MRITDFESWGYSQYVPVHAQRLEEALDPARVVAWYNRQTRELQALLKTESGTGGNRDSALKLQTILNTWLDPKFRVTASMNIEAFDALSAVAKQYAEADPNWKYHSYVSHLYDSLSQAVASLEANGMVGNGEPEEAPDMGGGAPVSDFGPSDGPPGEGAPPPPPGAPGEEEMDSAGAPVPDNPDNPEEQDIPGTRATARI